MHGKSSRLSKAFGVAAHFFSQTSPRAVSLICAVVTVVIWTAFIVVARASAQHHLGPFDIMVARLLGAGMVLLPWGAWLVRRDKLEGWLGLSPYRFKMTAIVGSVGGLLYALLAYTGFFYAPAAHASVLLPGSLPLWTTVLAAMWLGERITSARALGLACILLGDLLVGGMSLLKAFDGGDVWRGDLLFMAASLCWASYSIITRRYALEAVKTTIAIVVFALVVYLPVYGVLTTAGIMPSRLFTSSWGEFVFQMVFQGIGSVVISGITFTKMLQYFGAVRSTMITALVPGLSAFGAVIFLHEPLSWNLAAGLAFVTLGIVFGVQTVKKSAVVPKVLAMDRSTELAEVK